MKTLTANQTKFSATEAKKLSKSVLQYKINGFNTDITKAINTDYADHLRQVRDIYQAEYDSRG